MHTGHKAGADGLKMLICWSVCAMDTRKTCNRTERSKATFTRRSMDMVDMVEAAASLHPALEICRGPGVHWEA